jgi:hypothetical protein
MPSMRAGMTRRSNYKGYGDTAIGFAGAVPGRGPQSDARFPESVLGSEQAPRRMNGELGKLVPYVEP